MQTAFKQTLGKTIGNTENKAVTSTQNHLSERIRSSLIRMKIQPVFTREILSSVFIGFYLSLLLLLIITLLGGSDRNTKSRSMVNRKTGSITNAEIDFFKLWVGSVCFYLNQDDIAVDIEFFFWKLRLASKAFRRLFVICSCLYKWEYFEVYSK